MAGADSRPNRSPRRGLGRLLHRRRWQAAGLPVTFIGRPRIIGHDIAAHGLTLSDYQRLGDAVAPATSIIAACPSALARCRHHRADGQERRPPRRPRARSRRMRAAGRAGHQLPERHQQCRRARSTSSAAGSRSCAAWCPSMSPISASGRFHKGVAGQALCRGPCRRRGRLRKRSATGPAALEALQGHARRRLGQAAHQPQQCGECACPAAACSNNCSERDYRRVVAARSARDCGCLKRAGIEPGQGRTGPAAAAAAGDRLARLAVQQLLPEGAGRSTRKARSSMADDLAAGRKTEVDYINGELVRLAERLGVDAPVNRAIVELVRKAEAGPSRGPRQLRGAKCSAASGSSLRAPASSSGTRSNGRLRLGPGVEAEDRDHEDDDADGARQAGSSVDERERRIDLPVAATIPAIDHARTGFRRRSVRSPAARPCAARIPDWTRAPPTFVEMPEQRADRDQQRQRHRQVDAHADGERRKRTALGRLRAPRR